MTERARNGVAVGAVEAFDEAVGLGSIRGSDGAKFPFHCVEIEGGVRTIDTGTSVEFEVRHKLGRREAVAIRPR